MTEAKTLRSDAFEPTDEQVADIERMSNLGVSLAAIATFLGVSRETLRLLRKRDGRVSQALLKGHAKAERFALAGLYNSAFGTDKDNKPYVKNVSLAIFWFKTRLGLKDGDHMKDDLNTDAAQGQPGTVVRWNIRGIPELTEEALKENNAKWYDS